MACAPSAAGAALTAGTAHEGGLALSGRLAPTAGTQAGRVVPARAPSPPTAAGAPSGSTMSVPWIMFIPHANPKVPVGGARLTVVCSNAGRDALTARPGKT